MDYIKEGITLVKSQKRFMYEWLIFYIILCSLSFTATLSPMRNFRVFQILFFEEVTIKEIWELLRMFSSSYVTIFMFFLSTWVLYEKTNGGYQIFYAIKHIIEDATVLLFLFSLHLLISTNLFHNLNDELIILGLNHPGIWIATGLSFGVLIMSFFEAT